jgi:hypothetical protein
MSEKWLLRLIVTGAVSFITLLFVYLDKRVVADETVKLLYYSLGSLEYESHFEDYLSRAITPESKGAINASKNLWNHLNTAEKAATSLLRKVFVDSTMSALQLYDRHDDQYQTIISDTHKMLQQYIKAMQTIRHDTIAYSESFITEWESPKGPKIIRIPADTIPVDFKQADTTLKMLVSIVEQGDALILDNHEYRDPSMFELLYALTLVKQHCLELEKSLGIELAKARAELSNRSLAEYNKSIAGK